MLKVPSFENAVLITDDPVLAARVSSLFSRLGRYLPVMDGPRMLRTDADNEVIRRRNAMIKTGARQILIGGIAASAVDGLRAGWPNCSVSELYEEHVQALRGMVKRPTRAFRWGPDNLGIGLYQARLARQEFHSDLETSPDQNVVEVGKHLLVACECGDPLGEVVASNLAFACGASFTVFPELPKSHREEWLEEMYALGDGGDVTSRFSDLVQRARSHLGQFDFSRYKCILFVTAGFPWGIAVPEVTSTHMYRNPDFGRAIIEGIWASMSATRSSRNALLVDPQTVEGSEISAINMALLNNGTLTRVVRGSAATQARVQNLFDLVPHDIIVLSSHAGDAPGERITYEYPDSDGCLRRLVVDRALSFGYDASEEKFRVMEFHRYHSIDGVDWRDKVGKKALSVGTALTTWIAMGQSGKRVDCIVDQQKIPRVIGSMAMQLHDGVWLFASHGFPAESAPLLLNNSCWSWHELSQRTTFAGARGYVGSLFPITDAEAQEIGQALFGRYIGEEMPRALWHAQRDIYGSSVRRPYVMVGLPFVAIRPNTTDAVSYILNSYTEGIAHWAERAGNSTHTELRMNSQRFTNFLVEDLKAFRKNLKNRRFPS